MIEVANEYPDGYDNCQIVAVVVGGSDKTNKQIDDEGNRQIKAVLKKRSLESRTDIFRVREGSNYIYAVFAARA